MFKVTSYNYFNKIVPHSFGKQILCEVLFFNFTFNLYRGL